MLASVPAAMLRPGPTDVTGGDGRAVGNKRGVNAAIYGEHVYARFWASTVSDGPTVLQGGECGLCR